jgi:hypothetical protein
MSFKLYKDSNGEVFSYPTDGSQNHLIGNKTPITQSEFDAINEAKFAPIRERFIQTLSYAEKRALEYPPLSEQMDAFWKGGAEAEAMKAKINAVKIKYPKP